MRMRKKLSPYRTPRRLNRVNRRQLPPGPKPPIPPPPGTAAQAKIVSRHGGSRTSDRQDAIGSNRGRDRVRACLRPERLGEGCRGDFSRVS